MRLRPSTLKRSTAIASGILFVSAGMGMVAVPANAATVPGVSIDVDAYGAAYGYVGGTSVGYTSVLTAVGSGTCALANGPAAITAFNTGSGNPSRTHTNGAVCRLYDATVEYQLTYTAVVGATSTFYRTCVWVLGNQTCSVRGLSAI